MIDGSNCRNPTDTVVNMGGRQLVFGRNIFEM